MEGIKLSLFLLCNFVLGFAVCSSNQNSEIDQGKTWCIAQLNAPVNKLQGVIDYACSRYDCRGIQPGGSCYNPNTVQNHASYALDLIYRKTGVCNTQVGTPALTDPSYRNCHYP